MPSETPTWKIKYAAAADEVKAFPSEVDQVKAERLDTILTEKIFTFKAYAGPATLKTGELAVQEKPGELFTLPAAATANQRIGVACKARLGGPIYPKTLTSKFATERKAAGIPTGTLHILRHTAATLALTADPPVPLHIVAARLGDDPRTLLSTYAHLLPRSDAQAAEAVAAVLLDSPLTVQAV